MKISYLIHTANLFDTTIITNYVKSSTRNVLTIHSPLFIEVSREGMQYTSLLKLCEQHATKVVRKTKHKNSTKYVTILNLKEK